MTISDIARLLALLLQFAVVVAPDRGMRLDAFSLSKEISGMLAARLVENTDKEDPSDIPF